MNSFAIFKGGYVFIMESIFLQLLLPNHSSSVDTIDNVEFSQYTTKFPITREQQT
jgi:hypothetical protein